MPEVDEVLQPFFQPADMLTDFAPLPEQFPDIDAKPFVESLMNALDILETVPFSNDVLYRLCICREGDVEEQTARISSVRLYARE